VGGFGGQLQEAIQPGSAFRIDGVHPPREIEAVMSNNNHPSLF
jgi:hypothetical protein